MIFVKYILVYVSSVFLFYHYKENYTFFFPGQFTMHEFKQGVSLVSAILQALIYLKSACCESNESVN